MDLAYAVVRDDPPQVFAARDIDVLHRVIALEIVARTSPATLSPVVVDSLRDALLEERWGDAVETWMRSSGRELDVYPSGLQVWTDDALRADFAGARLQFTPLFSDNG